MMKKLPVLLLALLSAALLTACSGDDDPGNTNDLNNYLQEEVVIDSYTVGESIFHFASIDSETVSITGYEGPTSPHDVTIPTTVPTNADGSETKTVSTIADNAFFGMSSVRSVILPEGVTTIGSFAFAQCVQLSSVQFPSTLETIGRGAFQSTGLTELNFPDECALTEIGEWAFSSCNSLKEVTVPGYIETIGDAAFFGCAGIERIVLEEGVVTVGKQAFQQTLALNSLTLPSTFANENPTEDLAFSGSQILYRENIICPEGSNAEAYADQMVLALSPTEDEEEGAGDAEEGENDQTTAASE